MEKTSGLHQNMTSIFLLIGHLIVVIPLFSAAEGCIICDYFVLVGEPTAITCPIITLPVLHSDYNLTWYKNGSATPVTTERDARIHQREGLLWFIPAMLEDSGIYECNVRSLNHSNKKTINLTVFKNDNGLCFNGRMKFEQKVTSTNTGKIICPDLEQFKDEDNNQPEVHWYKECKPGFLEDKRLLLAEGENSVLIRNVTVQDRGNYTCHMVYTYMGKQYNVSRTISLEVKEKPLQMQPEFIYPRNNTIEVELGSHVVMECNVSSGINGLIPFWQVNDEDVDIFDKTYREQFYEEGLPHGLALSGTKFNISKVKVKDYAHKFFCHFIYGSQEFTAYIKLERPAQNIQGYLIGGGVSLVFLVFFTLFIYKIFKIDIVLWYRDSCHPFLGKKASDEKIYDAYVLYPKNRESCLYSSDIFALKILPEVLERQCGYNLFILGRDDLPGEAVISVADEKIRQSRRVIIVLVPEPSCYTILEDESEKQLAMHSALIQDGIKVILIELDKIQDYATMPESIRYIKQKHGAIRWKGDFSERSHSASTRFWKKVRYQMPSRKSGSLSELHLLPKDLNLP
ncbi:interleukin-1 receptor type 1 isoform X1 [Catharus ustulatus]|uniref:Interleukin-1 receptor type 1 n=1 Tax=Catharus ustulatus TaxID=91951 RepID=A0A8C3VDM4_CATUS|nr:interleukin-1 receptor type 1 isoform X1 [Catharus ustulatus]XP_032908810.1 interleukin-1 receptor type 1 isoform X1 [Catharus ustulatus]XP_032908811.1 interleukin-1 receptor type 1 isoform X1 [Catharus ustulatus]XP_032908813.1 interleukin-1 receptor type 1 isoform X1 [Catharus ustulatus]XP_032908814.1 interleukin-1 receptor type 1 isoform X1 [Catharus ustulatus]XP_032908815.1 interleukin-1 receptor type 1 isoform X1 [Catharus ustulatus]